HDPSSLTLSHPLATDTRCAPLQDQLYLALHSNEYPDNRVAARLAGLAVRIHEHAPLWADYGARLVAVVSRVRELQRVGDRSGLTGLLWVMVRWLFRISRGAVRLPGTSQ
ncbi:hypothetical protein, partial [Micromonospora inaquosa]